MIVGIGVDMVSLPRFRELMERRSDAALRRFFTEGEAERCRQSRSALESFAARFAAKEAFFKALGTGWGLDSTEAAQLAPFVYGVVLYRGGSTGGMDIIAAWVRSKYPEASFVWIIFCLNASVAAISFFVYGYQFEPVIMCLIYCYVSSQVSGACRPSTSPSPTPTTAPPPLSCWSPEDGPVHPRLPERLDFLREA